MNKIQQVTVAVLCGFFLSFSVAAKGDDLSGAFARNLSSVPKYNVSSIARIENEQSKSAVLLDVDRKDRIYRKGEKVIIRATSSEDGYLYLVNINPKNEATLLVPNKYLEDNTIKANQKMMYPTAEMNFDLEVGGPTFGRETIKAFVTKDKLKSMNKGKFTEDIITALSSLDVSLFEKELNGRKEVYVKERRTGSAQSREDFATGSVSYTTISSDESRTMPVKGKRYAIVIGINRYLDKKINTLEVCENDAKMFAQICTKFLGVEENDCIILINENATLQKLHAVFNTLKEYTKPEDIIFIFWSGHGGQTASTSRESQGSYDQFLVPYDGDTTKPFDTMLMEDTFGHWTLQLNGRNIVMFLDACYSGGMAAHAKSIGYNSNSKNSDNGEMDGLRCKIFGSSSKSISGGNDSRNQNYVCKFGFGNFKRSKSLGQNGLYILASSSYDQISFEGENTSVMTKYLAETIENGSVSLTHKDLKGIIENKVLEYVKKRYQVQQTVVEQDDLNPGLNLKP